LRLESQRRRKLFGAQGPGHVDQPSTAWNTGSEILGKSAESAKSKTASIVRCPSSIVNQRLSGCSRLEALQQRAESWRSALDSDAYAVHVDLISETTVLRPVLRQLSPLLRPLFAWNHRWTTPRGEKGLRAYLAANGRRVRAEALPQRIFA
jgi:hypothetical protein